MPPDHDPKERRRSPRASIDLQVALRFDSVQHFLSTCAGDISEGGMFVRVRRPQHQVGQTVWLRFDAGKERIVHGSARIVRVEDSGLALEFLDLDESSRKLIEMIVRIQLAAD